MRRDTAGVLTDRELDLMNVLWDHGPGTASTVRARLGQRLAHTTVLTILQMLEAKRFVAHTVEGTTQRFYPTVTRQSAAQASIRYLKHKLFCGSGVMLLEHLLDEEPSDHVTIQQMSRALARRLYGTS
jgi:BlaI family transcriptional regulator, penicillinase repressor